MSETTEATKAAPRPKVRTSYDTATRTATVTQPDGTATKHSADELSAERREEVFGRGYTMLLTTAATTPYEAHRRIVTGEWGGKTTVKDKELAAWRLAAAHAIVEKSKSDAKKSGAAAVTIEEAQAMAGKLGHEQLPSIKRDPLIVKHYDRLNPVEGDVLGALMSAA